MFSGDGGIINPNGGVIDPNYGHPIEMVPPGMQNVNMGTGNMNMGNGNVTIGSPGMNVGSPNMVSPGNLGSPGQNMGSPVNSPQGVYAYNYNVQNMGSPGVNSPQGGYGYNYNMDPSTALPQVIQAGEDISNELEQLKHYIQTIHTPAPHDAAKYVNDSLNDIDRRLTLHLKSLDTILNCMVLDPMSITKIHRSGIDLNRHKVQVNLYRQEIQHMQQVAEYGSRYSSNQIFNIRVFATLYVNQQPFPYTIKQHSTSNIIEVVLLTGAKSVITPTSPVIAEQIADFNIQTGKRQPFKNHEEVLKQRIARFSDIRYVMGTACKTVQMKFKVTVQSTHSNPNAFPLHEEVQLESVSPTEPYIVMTNTKQWAEAQGILLKKDMFMTCLDVTGARFCNVLQRHYLSATKQNPECPSRPLTQHDFQFFFEKKLAKQFNNNSITQKDFDNFWAWFGPVLQKIRYYKFLLPMWKQGLVCGMIGKADAERYLQPFGAGTFLIRFSERKSGCLAVAYKQSKDMCRHYLIKNTDTTGQGKSLPNFIRDSASFLQFLRISDYNSYPQLKMSPIDKYQALQKIGNKKRKTTEDGTYNYDNQIMDLVVDGFSNFNVGF